jgi:hypothetical protein
MGELIAIRISTSMMRNHELPEGFKVAWVESDAEQVSHAEKIFNRYINEGWIAFYEDGKEKKQILRFDPKLTKIILIPPIGGG